MDLSERTFGVKKCVWCGKEFVARSPKQNSCGEDHYRPCAMCGKPLLVKESYINYMKYGPRTCSLCKGKKIRETRSKFTSEQLDALREKTRATNQERYGVANPMQCKEIQQRVHDSVVERYGVDNLSQSSDIQAKIRENSRIKYGVEHYSQDPEIRERMHAGMEAKYGVRSAQQVEAIREATKLTCIDRYGVPNVAQSESVKSKMRDTCMTRYGVEYAAAAPEFIEMRKQTNLARYGAPGYVFSRSFIETIMTDPSKIEQLEEFKQDPAKYLAAHYSEPPTYRKLSEDLGIDETTVIDYIHKNNLIDRIHYTYSNMENDVYDFLCTLIPSTEIVRNCRRVITPKELDIWVPSKNFAIECNPTSTHNSDIGMIATSEALPYNYHKCKTDMCNDKGITLLHLFGYDWNNRRSVMESIIRHQLGATTQKVYARNTAIHEVSSSMASEFLKVNHRQGSTISSIRLGLYHDDVLVSLMTFGKVRPTQGGYDKDAWELSRFCSQLNTVVVGAASKLFSYFCKTYNPVRVISFSDRATTSGNIYQQLGFHKMHETDPGYVWVSLKDDSYYPRASCQKRALPKLLNEPDLDIETQTEVQIMKAHSYVRVFDAGLIKWVYEAET